MSDQHPQERETVPETMLEAAHRQAEHNEAIAMVVEHLAPILAEFDARLQRVERALANPDGLDELVRRVVEERMGTITAWRARIEGRMQRFQDAVLARHDEPELFERLLCQLDPTNRRR
jgi:hypothetical protein